MTVSERTKASAEWLKTVKVGDEVCVTNTYDYAARMIYSMLGMIGNEDGSKDEICIITTIRGVLSDGCIIVEDKIYNPDGTIGETGLNAGIPSLHPVTDELRRLNWRHNFYKSVKGIGWDKISDEGVSSIIDIINHEIKMKEEQAKKEKQEKEAQEAKEAEEKKNCPVTLSDHQSGIISATRMTSNKEIHPVQVRCPDCPNSKNNEEDSKNENKS